MKVLVVMKVCKNYVPLTRKKKLRVPPDCLVYLVFEHQLVLQVHSNMLYRSVEVGHVHRPCFKGEMIPLHCMFETMCANKMKTGNTQNSKEHILTYKWKMKLKQARQTFDENGQVKIGLLNKHFVTAKAEYERLLT